VGRYGRWAAAMAGITTVSLLSGCGLAGTPKALLDETTETMTVTSPVVNQRVMSAEYTCDGAGTSPPIFWSGAPPGTKSLAVVVDDSAAPIVPKVYWLVFDIGPATTDLQTGTLPPHAQVAYNSAGKPGYDPPCPIGSPHNYRFTVYALDTFLGKALPGQPQLLPAWSTISKHVIARGTLTGRAAP